MNEKARKRAELSIVVFYTNRLKYILILS